MSPPRKLAINVSIFVAAVLAVLGWAIRSSASAIDGRYVHVDAFAVYQAGEAELRLQDSLRTSLRFQLDSAFMQRILDATCADRPTVRACRP